MLEHLDRAHASSWSKAVGAWTRADGDITDSHAEFVQGDAAIEASSPALTVSSDGRLSGDVTLDLRRAGKVLDRALTSSIGQENASGLAGSVLRGIASQSKVVVTFDGKDTRFAGQRLAAAPKIFDVTDKDDAGADARLVAALEEWSAARRDTHAATSFAPGADAVRTRALLGDASETALIAWRALNARTAGLDVIAIWGGSDTAQVADLTRRRFGFHAMLQPCATPEAAVAGAKGPGCAAVLAIDAKTAWWGRLLVEPTLQVFALLPET